MKTKMKALDILDRLIQKVFFLDRYRRPGKPGEMITSLPPEEREELNKLTSDEAEKQTTPGAPYWCENHYRQIDADKELSDAKLKFDAIIKH